ncbi:MAG: hypothetical protein IT317_04895 [Anaerolineales bacterium]|nr:hypothetical protein [Anaerolineales bacterium]
MAGCASPPAPQWRNTRRTMSFRSPPPVAGHPSALWGVRNLNPGSG